MTIQERLWLHKVKELRDTIDMRHNEMDDVEGLIKEMVTTVTPGYALDDDLMKRELDWFAANKTTRAFEDTIFIEINEPNFAARIIEAAVENVER